MRGWTWSTLSAAASNSSPQYTHRYPSRAKISDRFTPLASVKNVPDDARRYLFKQVTRFFDTEESAPAAGDLPPRLTMSALEGLRMSRTRERILTNLEEMYREAFDRAKESGEPNAMAQLDFAYRREQLYFEILLDVRDAMEKR